MRYLISRGAGFSRSTDAGATWSESNAGIGAVHIRAIAVNPANSVRVYAGQAESDGSVVTWPFFRSNDGDGNWAATGNAFSLDWIRGLLVDSNTAATPASTVIYAVGRDIAPNVPLNMRASGVAKSSDGGATWSNLGNFAGLGTNPPVAKLATVRTIVPDRSVVTAGAWSKLYLTASGNGLCTAVGAAVNLSTPRLWRSLNAGSNWNTISTPGTTTVGSDGLPLGECVNGGSSWAAAGTGLAGQDIRSLLIDPDNSLRIYAASGGSALNPGGVFFSEDGGATWNSISAGLPVTSATALALDNSTPATPTLYAGTRTGTYSFTRVSDGDGDGSPTAPEDGAPNNGDGNADGVADSAQSSVASLPGTAALMEASLPFTVSLTPLTGSCGRLYDVIAVPADTFAADPAVLKPNGAFRFEIANCTSVRVNLRIHGGSLNARSFIRALGARVQGDPLSIGWNTLGATVSGDTISFVLNDNQPGDARQDSGRILFQGGPAFELPVFASGFEQ